MSRTRRRSTVFICPWPLPWSSQVSPTRRPLIRINSESLRVLDVSKLNCTYIVCQCPQLERCECNANYSLPELSLGQYEETARVVRENDGDLEVLSESMPFLGIDVPPSCLIIARHFPFSGGYDSYLYLLNSFKSHLPLEPQN